MTADPNRQDNLEGKCNGRLENEISMDEFIGLFSGLRYVQKFVDEEAFAKPMIEDSLKYFVNWTREIANRLMKTKEANPTHSDRGIRNPEYLKLSNFSFTVLTG